MWGVLIAEWTTMITNKQCPIPRLCPQTTASVTHPHCAVYELQQHTVLLQVCMQQQA
jgi:hypothetical protein